MLLIDAGFASMPGTIIVPYAELQFGAGHGLQSTLYAVVGTGIGGALILNGQLCRGMNRSAGYLEAYATGPVIARRYYQLRGLSASADLRPVVAAAGLGDALAI